jgi:ABC-type polysaccharide/polyol phosphate export permease
MTVFAKFIRVIKENKDLIRYLTFFDLKSNVARTYMGFLWWIIDPLLYMMIYYLLVVVILNRGGDDYPVILFTGLIPLKFTTACLVDATSSIVGRSNIIKQIYVPKIVFILVRLCVNSIKFLLGSVVLVLFLFFYGIDFNWTCLIYPVIGIVHTFVLLPFMILFAHVGVYLRDIKNLMQYVARVLLYVSPVLYTISDVPKKLITLFYINPFTTIIESYRNILLTQSQPLWLLLACLIVISFILLYISLKVMFKYENDYAKVI